MSLLEAILIWGTIYLYTAASVLLLTAFVFNKERLLGWSGYLLATTFAVHTVEFGLRWWRTGYFPANGDYEVAMVEGWFIMAFTVYLYFSERSIKGLALVTIPFVLLFMGYGVMKDPAQMPVTASLKSAWLLVHVLFAQMAFGAYAIACGLGAVYLLKDNAEKKGAEGTLYRKLPPLPRIEENMFRFVVYGFIAMAIEIAAGAIWAKDLWGKYWGWDPVEVWSLVSWLIYGLAIHLRVTLGWKGRRLAWLMIFAIVTVIIAFWGVDLMVKKTHRFFGMESGTEIKGMGK